MQGNGLLTAANGWANFAQKAAEHMDPYRDTPGWSALVVVCPELALPEDSDEEDWRAGLAKVKAQPVVKREEVASADAPTASNPSFASKASVSPPPPTVDSATASIVPANTTRTGPVPRPPAAPSAVRATSLPPVTTLESLPVAIPHEVSAVASAAPTSDGSDNEDEDEAEESHDEEVVELPADPSATAATVEGEDDDEGPTNTAPKRLRVKQPAQGSRQTAKDYPAEIRPEDVSLGAYRAGPDLVVRVVFLPLPSLDTDSVFLSAWLASAPRSSPVFASATLGSVMPANGATAPRLSAACRVMRQERSSSRSRGPVPRGRARVGVRERVRPSGRPPSCTLPVTRLRSQKGVRFRLSALSRQD